MIITNLFTVQYWNERDMQWRGTGTPPLSEDNARARMRGMSVQCGHCVRFRLEQASVV